MAINQQTGGIRALIEDNALARVPDEQKQSGWKLVFNTAGLGTTLVIISIGGGVSYAAGTRWGLLCGLIAAVFGSALGWAVGHVAQVAGTSSTVTSRAYGLGIRGSALASVIFAFMILGFLALEDALLYYGTLFMFGWAPDHTNQVLIYGAFTLIWIVLTTFGLRLVQRSSMLLTSLAIVLIAVVTVIAVVRSTTSIGQIWDYSPPHLSVTAVLTGLSAIAGIGGSLSLNGADFARYARSNRDVGIMSIGGNFVVNFLVVVVGTLIFQAGSSTVTTFLTDPSHAAQAGALAGANTAEKITFMTNSDVGAYFVILAGALGFIVMLVAQAKAQVLNTYSGSLALTNLVNAGTGFKVSRFWMVLLGNAIALIAVSVNILSFINSWLGLLGILTTSLATLLITDYFAVRRRQPADPARIENFNWAGIIALVVGSAVAYFLVRENITSLGFLVALVLTSVLYTGLRRLIPAGIGGWTTSQAGPALNAEAEPVGH